MCPSTCDVVDAKVQLLLCNEVFYAPQSYMITISFCVSSSIARPGSNMARFSIASNAFWGIDILFKAEQPLNGSPFIIRGIFDMQPTPKYSIDSGIFIVSKLVQPSKTHNLIVVMVSGRLTSFRAVHPENVWFAKYVTDSGITTLVRALQFLNILNLDNQ